MTDKPEKQPVKQPPAVEALNKVREAFEQWYAGTPDCPSIERRGGGYKLMQANLSWGVWQAAYEALQPRSEWQDISTAPKRTSLLLGWHNELGKWRTVRGCWFEAGDMVDLDEEPTDVSGWFEESVTSDDLPNTWPINPTHWQLLPPPPAAKTE